MRFVKLALVLSLGLLFAGTAAAQPGPGGFGGFGGGLAFMIGNNKGLQDELKVSKEQADKLTEALNKVRDDMRDDMAKLRDRGLDQGDRDKIMKKMSDANAKAVDAVLKPDQVKRLKQIENQQAGFGIFNKEEVKTALKLSDKQDEEIKDINKDLQKDLREIRGGGFGGFDPEAQKKRADLTKEAMANATKILNDKQKATLKDLTGEPFTVVFAPPGGGGFGPGGGGFGPGGGQPGQILSTRVQDTLKLTDEQKKKLEELQKDLDSKLEKILTEDQKKQLKDMQTPGGPRRPQ